MTVEAYEGPCTRCATHRNVKQIQQPMTPILPNTAIGSFARRTPTSALKKKVAYSFVQYLFLFT
jgi:hypothetical protein